MDLRLDEVNLPEIGPDDVRIRVVSDSLCMSTYKAAIEGGDHKRVLNNCAENPTIVGHEFCGDIVEVGENWKNKYNVGDKFVIQPAHYYKGSQEAPGYSYAYCGGNSQYCNVPIETLLMNCLLPYNSDTYYYGSLAEPLSCVIGTFHAMYHTKAGSYVHEMGIKEGGKMALLASVGPMGLAAIDYALHCDRRPSLLVITDIDEARLERAASIYTVEEAKKQGIELHYVNTRMENATAYLRELTGGLNAVIDTTLNLPKIPGGKKLIYTQIDLPLTAITEFEEKGKTDPMFAELDRMCKANNGLWNPEAEKYLLANAPKMN